MEDQNQEDNEPCPGCDHLLDIHFKNIKGVIRCAYVETGVSSSGVIGIPYSVRCDCRNKVSKMAEQRRQKEELDTNWFRTSVEKILKGVKPL